MEQFLKGSEASERASRGPGDQQKWVTFAGTCSSPFYGRKEEGNKEGRKITNIFPVHNQVTKTLQRSFCQSRACAILFFVARSSCAGAAWCLPGSSRPLPAPSCVDLPVGASLPKNSLITAFSNQALLLQPPPCALWLPRGQSLSPAPKPHPVHCPRRLPSLSGLQKALLAFCYAKHSNFAAFWGQK